VDAARNGVHVLGDAGQLRILLLNVLGNGRRCGGRQWPRGDTLEFGQNAAIEMIEFRHRPGAGISPISRRDNRPLCSKAKLGVFART